MLALDTQYSNQADDIVLGPHRCESGTMRVPAGAGLGMQLHEEKFAQYKAEAICDPYLDPTQPDWFPVKPQY